MSPVTRWLSVAAGVAAGVNAGVFFTFSTFTMAGLRNLTPSVGMAAMQSINRAAPTPPLMTLMFGTWATLGALGVTSLRRFDEPGARLQVGAAAVFTIAVIGSTVFYHVPRNDALDALDAANPANVDRWLTYAHDWVLANHVRTLGAAAASALIGASLVVGDR